MALSLATTLLLRRASSLCWGIRSVGSRRWPPFCGALNGDGRSFCSPCLQNLPSVNNQLELDDDHNNLLDVLGDYINASEEGLRMYNDNTEEEEEIYRNRRKNVPFEIDDNPGGKKAMLKRRYGGDNEVITVVADIPVFAPNYGNVEFAQMRLLPEPWIPLVVNVAKPSKSSRSLEFSLAANLIGSFEMHKLTLKEEEEEADTHQPHLIRAYQPPQSRNCAKLWSKCWLEYLETRGINAITNTFLFDIMLKKYIDVNHDWMIDLECFLEN